MKFYNPLETQNLAESVVNELLHVPISPLESLLTQAAFEGAGVYVIYYAGDFREYAPYRNDADMNIFDKPIYVGKAIPPGGRKGGLGLDAGPGQALFKRLKEHLESVRQATNLDSKDFYFRFLAVDDIWIPLSERLLTTNYQPIWNVKIDGFGNHDPGAGRYNGKRSSWDAVHPGRPWAGRCQMAAQTSDQILARLGLGTTIEDIES